MDFNKILVGNWTAAVGTGETGSVSITALIPVDPRQSGQLVCDNTQDSTCEQHWIMTINTQPDINNPPVCNLQGLIIFNTMPLLCRDYSSLDYCQGSPNVNFSIAIGKTDLCDTAKAVDASGGLSLLLETYYDADYQIPQSLFQTGDMVYFKLIVRDPSSTIDQITFSYIQMRSTDAGITDTDELFSQPTPGDPLTTATMHADVGFNVTEEFRTPYLIPNSDGELRFNFRLLRNHLNLVSALSSINADSMTKNLLVEATIDILYHGNQNNKKREFAAQTIRPSITHTQIAFYDMEDEEEELTPHNNNDEFGDNNNAEGESLFDVSAASTSVVAPIALAVVAAFTALFA